MHQGFGVAVGPETVAPGDEVFPQRPVIIDLAVKNHPQSAVFVGDRLMPRAQVDNAQPPHADRAASFDVETLVVRTAMANPVAHAFYEFESGRFATPDIPRNAAHRFQCNRTARVRLLATGLEGVEGGPKGRLPCWKRRGNAFPGFAPTQQLTS